MKLVIDTNRIIASLIKPQSSRRIILDNKIQFITPDFTLSEIMKYREMVIQKANLIPEEFDLILYILFEHIDIAPKEDYETYLSEAKTLISDIKDLPFIALAIASKADGIWSDDTDFKKQNKIKIYTTADLFAYFNY